MRHRELPSEPNLKRASRIGPSAVRQGRQGVRRAIPASHGDLGLRGKEELFESGRCSACLCVLCGLARKNTSGELSPAPAGSDTERIPVVDQRTEALGAPMTHIKVWSGGFPEGLTTA